MFGPIRLAFRDCMTTTAVAGGGGDGDDDNDDDDGIGEDDTNQVNDDLHHNYFLSTLESFLERCEDICSNVGINTTSNTSPTTTVSNDGRRNRQKKKELEEAPPPPPPPLPPPPAISESVDTLCGLRAAAGILPRQLLLPFGILHSVISSLM